MCVLERRFSQWGNGTEDRKDTLWKERFRSVLLEADFTLRAVGLWMDLNPFIVFSGIEIASADFGSSPRLGCCIAGLELHSFAN